MTTSKNDGTNVQPNPYMDYKCSKGRDSDGIPYDEYDFTPPPFNAGDRYLRTLVDTRNNTLAHIAIVVKNKHECTGNLVAYITTRRGLFIHRLLVAGEEVSFICAFPDDLDAQRHQRIRDTSNLLGQRVVTPEPGSRLAEYVEKNGGTVYGGHEELDRLISEPLPETLFPIIEEAKKERRDEIETTKAIIDPERPNLDFDGDDPLRPRVATNPLTNLTLEQLLTKLEGASKGAQVVALERWVHEQGGLYAVLRSLAVPKLIELDEIPQIVPTPGSREMTNQANMEVAQKLCQPVIIDERNYGRLAVSNVSGIPFVGDIDDLAELGLPAIYISKTPKFNRDIALFVNWKVGEQTNFCPLYALEKEDINDLGRLLSKRGNKVQANFMAAHLKIWENGEVIQEYKSPEEFFACNEDWIERAKF